MTLVITHLSSLGIAMAADSALTTFDQRTSNRTSDANAGARKLIAVPRLHAAVAAWGRWTIGNEGLDDWLDRFINDNEHISTLDLFAHQLADELRMCLPPGDGSLRIGVQVAGYVPVHDRLMPTFYHVHDGPSKFLAER